MMIENFFLIYAGVLLGEDLAFQANEEGSNPFARSRIPGPTPVSE